MYHSTEVDLNIKSSPTSRIAIDEKTRAQEEFDAYIANQAQAIAPEPEVQFIDIDGFYNYSAQTAGKTIATITHDSDDFVTQPWVVMVGDVEVHRTDTWAKCAHYIQWHYKQGTLPKLYACAIASLEELLDLPFDQLTCVEWERLKEYKPQLDCYIAA